MSDWKKLTGTELFKYGVNSPRADLFKEKIKANDTFIITDNRQVKMRLSAEEKEDILAMFDLDKASAVKKFNATKFTTTRGREYKFTDLAKTPEFGGKGKGSGTRAQDLYLVQFRKVFESALQDEGAPILKIKIGRKIVEVATIEDQGERGQPKADWNFADLNRQPVAWISHKAQKQGSDDFQYGGQQYSGLVSLNNGRARELLEFVNDIKTQLTFNLPIGLGPGMQYKRRVTDRNIALRAVYGKDYRPSGPSGPHNIDAICIGNMGLRKVSGNVYELTSAKTFLHGDIPDGRYAPFYYVRRDQRASQFGIRNARFMIIPNGRISSPSIFEV